MRFCSHSVVLAAMLAVPQGGIVAAPPVPEPVQSLEEYARRLKDSERAKRLVAAEAIKAHYNGKAIAALPQIIEALGKELDQPQEERPPHSYLQSRLREALWAAAAAAGPSRINLIRDGTRAKDCSVRAAAFQLWARAAHDPSVETHPDELLTAVRQSLKDESALVRGQAVLALDVFQGPPNGVLRPGFATPSDKTLNQVMSMLIGELEDRSKPGNGSESPACHAASVLAEFRGRAKPAIPALAKAAETRDELLLVSAACRALQQIAKTDPATGEEIVRLLRPLLRDKSRPAELRVWAAKGLTGIGPAAEPAAEELGTLFEDAALSANDRSLPLEALRNLGPLAVKALPALVRRLASATEEPEILAILLTLEGMGPPAASALPAIERLREGEPSRRVVAAANRARAAIMK